VLDDVRALPRAAGAAAKATELRAEVRFLVLRLVGGQGLGGVDRESCIV
jgi:hypothetical protein